MNKRVSIKISNKPVGYFATIAKKWMIAENDQIINQQNNS